MHAFVHSARDRAMRSVERVVDQCGCQVRDTDRIDNLLRTQDTPTAVVSRWIAAADDSDYPRCIPDDLERSDDRSSRLDQRQVEGAQGDATASRTCDVCRYGVDCGFGVPIDLDPTILSTGLAGQGDSRHRRCAHHGVAGLRLNFNVDNIKWLVGTGIDESWRHLEHRRHRRSHHDAARADRNHGGDRARRHLHLQAIQRGNQVHANAILAMHPNVIDAFYRFVASGSTSEPQIFWHGRSGPLLGRQVLGGQRCRRASRPRISD